MAKDRVERQLENLKALRAAGSSEDSVKELRKALSDKVNVIVAKAASIADEWQSQALLPDLTSAFSRLFVNPGESDPQCWGKNAISKTLKNLGCAESAVFLKGVQHQQWESVWGGKTDTAGVLRGTCALALVQCSDLPRDEILLHLVSSVTDADAKVRADGARALEQMGGREATLLLRLKARSGDKEARVTGQVLESILQLESTRGISFVAEFLQHADDEVSEEAALALGVSRLPEAVDLLKEAFLKLSLRRSGESLLRAISASRLDSALAFLLDQVRTARPNKAEEALHALGLHRDSEQIVKQVEAAVSGREDLLPVFRKAFAIR